MAKQKSARSLGDIFTSTSPATPAAATKDKFVKWATDELVQESDLVKTTTFFTQDQLDYLDEQTREIRRATKKTMKRTPILRGLVQGLLQAKVNLQDCGSVEALAEAIQKRMPLKGGKL